ncbi:outer membrane protein assembly factor BamB family protein [Yinghuangia soli]|uniref:PQQ-binding-like beta-propeller repeat protein n=1 Tax=Yinghuangia soli TaxID=2908204 RepID=A0AA41PX76_9ACTN|nr:PQQ-binding-like beta-propeller repeat protein [Yinghuangia soli]MCF2527227.1 PQQ-binding-like beta-propeller repeat protein [Yinghuangia soli]
MTGQAASPPSRRGVLRLAAALTGGAVLGATGCGTGGSAGVPRRAPLWTFRAEDNEWIQGRPAVGSGQLYVTTDADRRPGGSAYGIDAATGQVRWRFRCGGETCAPALVGDVVVFGSGSENSRGTWYGLDAATGSERWRVPDLGSDWTLPTVVSDGVVYVNSSPRQGSGMLVAIRASDGQRLWSFPTPSPSMLVSVAGEVVHAVDPDGNAVGLDTRTGRPRWTGPLRAYRFGPAVPAGELAYVLTQDADWNLGVAAYHPSDGTVRWQTGPELRANALISVADGAVYYSTASGGAGCLDAATGSHRWFTPLPRPDGSNYMITPVGDHLYVAFPRGSSVLHALDRATGAPRWETKVYKANPDRLEHAGTEWVAGGPDGNLLGRDQDRFVGRDPATGSIRWTVGGVRVQGGAVVTAGTTAYPTHLGELYAVDIGPLPPDA